MSSLTNLAKCKEPCHFAFIGSAGIPNRYGGFEAFLEHCAPVLAAQGHSVTVTCDRSLYNDREASYRGVVRLFIGIRANGIASIIHDLCAFFRVYRYTTHIVVLGVSGGPWFPLWRLMCTFSGKRLIVNIDGVEWRRSKFTTWHRCALRFFDAFAQIFSHVVVYDNVALLDFVLPYCRSKAVQIGYPGDHVLRFSDLQRDSNTALTICRIEPENQINLLIEGALLSKLNMYTVVGNWNASEYGRKLRNRYSAHPRLNLLDPIYDSKALAQLREQCGLYLHGHSVGGTNPSLVEMLFYDCVILCFDCSFNRETAGHAASYFSDANELARLIEVTDTTPDGRAELRKRYTATNIASEYVDAAIT
ncbi:DUF1972 domain-containing protein [Hydrogenophaga sp.]|uniref:DUF1972 domain-containing protein n=1 Tax=Hydrogenophaga sp. TaxID=1904254 RepID=UPI002619462A|nr:DUF1972 domain-containing protein [Hydrogenophaga sp.]MDM7948219.1 DUF1972 domain-containing protein [Hydrogenophaga sp.]